MELYLVQHGEAEPKSIDPVRPLTDRGRRQVQQVAAFAARMGLEIGQIRHSGKTRAEQTAAILGEALRPPGGVVPSTGLAPDDDVQPLVDALMTGSPSVMLVGHLPSLTRLSGLLLAGDPYRPVVAFRYAAIVCLLGDGSQWSVAWILTPEMAGALGG